MNRLITAAVAIFGDEQHTINILQRTRFFSKAAKPLRRKLRMEGRRKARDRLSGLFLATAFTRVSAQCG